MEALEATGYGGYVTFEFFHPAPHYPEAPIYYMRGRARPHAGQAH